MHGIAFIIKGMFSLIFSCGEIFKSLYDSLKFWTTLSVSYTMFLHISFKDRLSLEINAPFRIVSNIPL